MRLRVLVVGKLKDRGLEELESSFVKRSRSLVPIEVLELRSMDQLRGRLNPEWIALDERGETPTSPELASWIERAREAGRRQMDFAIGDAHGFTDEDRRCAKRVLSLSRLTFPHRIARVVLIEQLYRAGTILAGHPYHHA